MSKSLYSSVDSLGEASRRFVTLIATAGKVIQHIESIYENAQYNKRICNLFLDRVDVVPAYIKKLGRKQEENEHLFRNENYYKHFVRFTNVLCEIETFLKDITRLSGYSKYRNFKEMFEKLTRDIDNVMRNLNFKTTVAPEEQKLIDQRDLEEDYEEMEKFLESIQGGIVDDNKRMNTSLQEVLIIKNQVESKDKQDSNDSPIMATQISSTMLQDPMYKKSRGKENQIHKKVLNDDDDHKEVAFQPITIPDKVSLPVDYRIVQSQLAILEKLHDSNNILKFYGLSTSDDGTNMVLEWAEFGGLDEVYNNYKISWPEKVSIALEICRGITFIHSCDILHHDIRCGNIMMSKKMEPKIANFDYARNVQDTTRELKNLTVAVHWLSPEKLYNPKQSYDFKCEIFSFGMLLWELGFERIPYEKWDMKQIKDYVLSYKRELVIYDDSDKEMLKLQEEYSKIFMGAWEHDLTLRTSLQTIFLQLKSLSEKYGKRNPNTTFTKKESNPDGTIVRSKYSVSVSDSEEPLETKQINKPGSITQILPFGEGRNAHKSKEWQKAWECFKAHAELGNTAAKYWKAYYMDEGRCGFTDKENAIKLYKEAADEGNGDAQLRYAFSLVDNKNFDKDLFIRYLTLSVDNENPTAIFNLGDLYYNGKLGVPKDKKRGIKFLKLAALHKQPKAIALLKKLEIDP
ncbi:12730_t:CDS:2 [Entrophospora sp. SA101]|nr:12730_t:CDS:2 [Entrophospora sp. SA101]